MLSEIIKTKKQITKLEKRLRHLDWKKRNKECLVDLIKKYKGKYFRMDPEHEYDTVSYTFVKEINWTDDGFECIHNNLQMYGSMEYFSFSKNAKMGGIDYRFGKRITKEEYEEAVEVAYSILE